MNGSHFHVYARTHDLKSVLEAVKKQPKLQQDAYWYANRPIEVRWVVKQSELLKFVERLLRCDVEEVAVTK